MKQIPCHLNAKFISKVNTDYCVCLAARDWKGLGTGFNVMGGVIIKYERDELLDRNSKENDNSRR